MQVRDVISCLHCGLPCPDFKTSPLTKIVSKKGTQFCCLGCETVYSILKESNLTNFYKIKEKLPLQTEEPATRSKTYQTQTKHDYDYLDNADYLKKHCPDLSKKSLCFYVPAIHCAACIWLIERLPLLYTGVASVSINFGQSTVTVFLTESGLFSEAAFALHQIGYQPFPDSISKQIRHKKNRTTLLRIGISGAVAANIMIFSVAIYSGVEGYFLHLFNVISGFLFLPSLLYSARPFFKSAYFSIKQLQFNIDIPVSVAIILGSSISYSHLFYQRGDLYFDSLSVFIFLLLSSRHIYQQQFLANDVDQNRLSAFLPKTCLKLNNPFSKIPSSKTTTTLLTESLTTNDCILVLEDTIIPVDGKCQNKTCIIDNQIFSGESDPIHYKQGDSLFAGMKNVGPDLILTVSSIGHKTRLGQLIEKSKSLQQPKLATLSHSLSKLLFIVLFLCIGWTILIDGILKGSLSETLNIVLALTIIACPCALALSTPLIYTMSLRFASSKGIFIKTPAIFERLAIANPFFFDKTGTLTLGQFEVNNAHWLCDKDLISKKKLVYSIIKQLEFNNSHPVAKALVRFTNTQIGTQDSHDIIEVKNITAFHSGVEGIYENNRYVIKPFSLDDTGPSSHAEYSDINTSRHTQTSYPDINSKSIETTIGLYKNDNCVLWFELGDTLHTSTSPVLHKLKDQGKQINLLSGDQKKAVEKVGNHLPFNSLYYEKTPEQKLEVISKHPTSCMIGDGANDSAALSKAYVSIAVQGSIEMALSVSDVYFTVSGLNSLPVLLSIAKQTQRFTYATLIISLIYNSVGIILAVLGFITPLIAAFFMPLSSATVLILAIVHLKTLQHKFKKEVL
ncbi:heavy metal translocating P-type ATPase [bacterium]|jgi:cation transport ATPase|nr:heavy metal translocating P-type ATPase [bacterium]